MSDKYTINGKKIAKSKFEEFKRTLEWDEDRGESKTEKGGVEGTFYEDVKANDGRVYEMFLGADADGYDICYINKV